ncbi:hypothetical protein NQD34_012553 [Periophthalmus magnuspinnatus]|nr:hypothetical protein NQD34_012553 [Periophthalmus magnuspinnatus]
MLLQRRAVFAFGRRLCSSQATTGTVTDAARPSSNMTEFRQVFSKANRIAVVTGAGVAAASGVPTFRGKHETWRKWKSQDLATPESFSRHPSRVWEFFHYRRELVTGRKPTAAHYAIAECEARLRAQGRELVVITQCIDDLHLDAGSKHVLKIHGNLMETRCVSCGYVHTNKHSPICAALRGTGSPEPNVPDADIPAHKLPRCEKRDCHGLLRPNVVFFGETLDSHVLTKVEKELEECDLCLVVGTSSIVYPAAMFGPGGVERRPRRRVQPESKPQDGIFHVSFLRAV